MLPSLFLNFFLERKNNNIKKKERRNIFLNKISKYFQIILDSSANC